MKDTLFYQVRQDNPLPLAELALLVRQAFISLYPGTAFDEDVTVLYGSENSFFLSRTGRTESIAVFVTPEPLDSEALAGFSIKAAEAEVRIREFRGQTREFLVSIVAAEIPERVKAELNVIQSDWSLFEYLPLQSETDEALALKPVRLKNAHPKAGPRKVSVLVSAPKAAGALSSEPLPNRRLSPEELSALIDLSLGLEMRSRGMHWDIPSKKMGTSSSRQDDVSRRRPDIDA